MTLSDIKPGQVVSDDFHKTKSLSAEFVSVIAFLKFLEKLGLKNGFTSINGKILIGAQKRNG